MESTAVDKLVALIDHSLENGLVWCLVPYGPEEIKNIRACKDIINMPELKEEILQLQAFYEDRRVW